MTITPADMKELESRFMAQTGVPGALLMEHAAQGVAAAIARYAPQGATVVFLCGPGNNGGDGYAAARLWAARGGRAIVCEMTEELHGDALLNRRLALLTEGVTIRTVTDAAAFDLPACDIIVDALFGTGLSRMVDGIAAEMIHQANESGAPVIAVDIPSGLDGTTGEVLGFEAIRAVETVTFHRIKTGLLLGSGPEFTGRITVQPILIPRSGDLDAEYEGLLLLEPSALEDCEWLRRSPVSHKGDFGRVVLLCGSRGMAGAAALCANAAMRTGAGLTTILCRESLLPILQTLAPGATCAALPERDGLLLPEATEIARHALERADAACIGCGLGLTPDVAPLLRLFAQAECPVLWDADALTLLARTDGLLPLKEADVITPHPGEAARLLDTDAEEITANALEALDSLHDLCGCTVLLKGARTLITDGLETWCNRWGTPAMAKGGSGDVLSGIITALLARPQPTLSSGRLSGSEAAAYGALIHGLAGLRAEKLRGENCVLPTDLVDCIRLDAKGID